MIGNSGSEHAAWSRRIAVPLMAILLVALATPCWSAAPSPRTQIRELIRAGRLDDAERELWKVLTPQPDEVWALDLLASIRMRQKRAPEAEALFRRSVTLNSKNVEAWRGLGDSCRDQGKRDFAIEAYEGVVKISPSDRDANIALAGLYQQAGKYRDSVESVSRLAPSARPPALLPILAADYFGLNRPTDVPPLIREVLRLAPSQPATALDFAAVLARNGYIDDAAQLLGIIRPAKPNADYLRTLARIRELQGNNAEAQKLLEQAIKLAPNSTELLVDAARFFAQNGHWDKTALYLQRADQIEPNRPYVLLKLVLAFLKVRQRDKAVTTARRLAGIAPDDPDALYMLAFAMVESEQWEMVAPVVDKLSKLRPNDADVELLLGIVHFRMGHPEEAKKWLQNALTHNPKLFDAHYYNALQLEQEANFDAANKELEIVVQGDPDHVAAQAEYGMVQMRLGNVEVARKALEHAVKLRPEVSQTHYQLGLVYTRLGMQEQAKAEMAEFQRLRTAEDNFRKREAGLPESSMPPKQ